MEREGEREPRATKSEEEGKAVRRGLYVSKLGCAVAEMMKDMDVVGGRPCAVLAPHAAFQRTQIGKGECQRTKLHEQGCRAAGVTYPPRKRTTGCR